MDAADNHLSRVVQQQIPMLKLAVNVGVIGSEFCGVNQLMELVRKAKVEELSIFVQTRDFHWYDDDVVFEQGCKFISNNNSGMYSSQQQLCLSQILLFSDEVLSNIAKCCPEIEVIEFDCCFFWISILQLSKFPNLKNATVEGHQGNLQSVDIRETYLETACSNIRVLELNQCYISEPDLLKDLTTSFPLLEKAELFDVMHYTEVFDRITTANSHLRSLKLLSNRVIQKISINCPKLRYFSHIGAGIEEVYLDCPKLRTCYYNLRDVPRKILLDLPTDIQYNVFSFSVDYKLGKSWFISIRKFLEQIAGCDTVYLRLDWHSPSPDMADEFVLDEFEGVQTFKPKNVHLQLKIYYFEDTSQFSAAFVDGLVWSTRPTTLSVGCDCYEFVKQLCNKYWWHNISDFEVKHKKEDMTQNLASLVEMTKQSRRGLSGRLRPVDLMPFCFKFEWHSTEQFTAKFLVEMARSNLNT
ncbi:F-box/LRR-repeat protein 15 [Bienertia sinuspersici]